MTWPASIATTLPAMRTVGPWGSEPLGTTTPGTGMILFGLLLLGSIYLTPAIIAFARASRYRWAILAVNLFGGWTGIGWLVALAWALWPEDDAFSRSIQRGVDGILQGSMTDLERIERLAQLRDRGVLSDDEFQASKTAILNRA